MVPSAAEAGLPDFQIWTWTGFYAPKGTPRELVARLNRDIVAACRDAHVLARLDTMGSTPSTTTPEEFAAFTRAEIARWGDIIRRGNIKLE
jgi:tripartite-type tricarboxylate transporter receptor subunit TctC